MAASTQNFAGVNLMPLKDALFLSTSRTAHLFDGGEPKVRVQSFPYHNEQWLVAHTVIIEEGIPCGIEHDAFGPEQKLLSWLVEHDYVSSEQEARALIECAVWEPEYAQITITGSTVKHPSQKLYRRCALQLVAAVH